MIYVIGVVEMCERFAYYGTTAVCMYDYDHICKACTDAEQSSTLFSNLCLPLDLSHQLALRERMVKLARWEWDNRLPQVRDPIHKLLQTLLTPSFSFLSRARTI